MFQLIYVSLAREPFSQERLNGLLEQAREKNARLAITGMLLYKNGSFMQAIEGKEKAVRGLYDEIRQDERHEQVRPLTKYAIDERDFPDWQMAFENVASQESMPEGYADLTGERFTSEAFSDTSGFARKMLLGFKERKLM